MRAVRLSHADSDGGRAGSGAGNAPTGVSNGSSSGHGPSPVRPARRAAITSWVVVPRAFDAAYAMTGKEPDTRVRGYLSTSLEGHGLDHDAIAEPCILKRDVRGGARGAVGLVADADRSGRLAPGAGEGPFDQLAVAPALVDGLVADLAGSFAGGQRRPEPLVEDPVDVEQHERRRERHVARDVLGELHVALGLLEQERARAVGGEADQGEGAR